jgi:hypothetical protein
MLFESPASGKGKLLSQEAGRLLFACSIKRTAGNRLCYFSLRPEKNLLRRAFPAIEKCGQNKTKTNIPVPVVRIVPVAVRTTRIVYWIVVRAAAQYTNISRACPFI